MISSRRRVLAEGRGAAERHLASRIVLQSSTNGATLNKRQHKKERSLCFVQTGYHSCTVILSEIWLTHSFHTQKLEEVSAHGLSRIICSDRMREGGYLVLIVSSGLFLLRATTWLVFECVFYLLKVDSDCESFVSPAVPPLWVTRQNCWLIHCSFVSPSGCRLLYLGCSFFFFFFQSGCLEKLRIVVLETWRPTNLGAINTCYSFIPSSSTSPTPRHIPLVLHPYQGWHFCYSSSQNSVQHFCFC